MWTVWYVYLNEDSEFNRPPFAPATTTMLGFPLTAGMVIAMANTELTEHFLVKRIENRVSALQLILEDFPSLLVDIAVVLHSTDGDGTVWFNVSLVISACQFLVLLFQCVWHFVQEENMAKVAPAGEEIAVVP